MMMMMIMIGEIFTKVGRLIIFRSFKGDEADFVFDRLAGSQQRSLRTELMC